MSEAWCAILFGFCGKGGKKPWKHQWHNGAFLLRVAEPPSKSTIVHSTASNGIKNARDTTNA